MTEQREPLIRWHIIFGRLVLMLAIGVAIGIGSWCLAAYGHVAFTCMLYC